MLNLAMVNDDLARVIVWLDFRLGGHDLSLSASFSELLVSYKVSHPSIQSDVLCNRLRAIRAS